PRPHPPPRRPAPSPAETPPRNHHPSLPGPRLHPHGDHAHLQRHQSRHPLLDPVTPLSTQIHKHRSRRAGPTLRPDRPHGQPASRRSTRHAAQGLPRRNHRHHQDATQHH